jgi:hypothetical protein
MHPRTMVFGCCVLLALVGLALCCLQWKAHTTTLENSPTTNRNTHDESHQAPENVEPFISKTASTSEPTTPSDRLQHAKTLLAELTSGLTKYKTADDARYKSILKPLSSRGGYKEPEPYNGDGDDTSDSQSFTNAYVHSDAVQEKLQFWIDYYNDQIAHRVNQKVAVCVLKRDKHKKVASTASKLNTSNKKNHQKTKEQGRKMFQKYTKSTPLKKGTYDKVHSSAVPVAKKITTICPCGIQCGEETQ